MQTKKRLFKIDTLISGLLVVLLSFVAGFCYPDIKKEPTLENGLEQVAALPQRLNLLLEESDSDGGSINVVQSYSKVLRQINSNYYAEPNEKIDDQKLTYSGIRGMLRSLNDPFT